MNCIIFPSNHREFTRPNIIVGKVKGYLKDKAVSADIMDLNIEWILFLLSGEGLFELKNCCEEQFFMLDKKMSVTAVEQKKYDSLARISLIPYKDLVDEAEKVMKILKGTDFYELSSLNVANRFITNILNVANILLINSNRNKAYNPFASLQCIESSYNTDFLRNKFLHKVFSHLDRYDNFIILLASETQMLDAFFASRYIKEIKPASKCILAGHPISILKDIFLESSKIFTWIDYAVYGEIEDSIYQLIQGKHDLSCIQNVIYKDSSGKNHINKQFQLEKLSSSIDYDGIDWDKYLSPIRIIPFSMTFGCIWGKCTFCNIHKSALQYKIRKVSDAVDNISELIKTCKTNIICFIDESLASDVMKEISEEIIKRHITINWGAQTRFEIGHNYEKFCEISAAGCKHIEFGLESADEGVQKDMEKGINNKIAKDNLFYAKKAGIITTLNLITGYPVAEDFSKTEQFLMKYAKNIDRINNFAFYVTKGSLIEENQERFSIQIHHNELNNLQITYTDFTSQNGLSRKEIEKQVFKIDNFVSKQSYGMEASMCPILEYSIYYETTDIDTIVKKALPSKIKNKMFQEQDIIKLRPGFVYKKLHFDLVEIKRRFNKCIAWTEIVNDLNTLPRKENTIFIYDTLHNIIYKPNKEMLWIVNTLSYPVCYEELVNQFSVDFQVSKDYSNSYLHKINQIYNILSVTSNIDGVLESEN